MLAGLTVYAVPQVLAATLPIGALTNQVGTVIKLVRVLMLGPVVLGFSLLAGGLRAGRAEPLQSPHACPDRARAVVHRRLSGAARASRSLGLHSASAVAADHAHRGIVTTIAMAGLGLGVDVRVVARTGVRVTLAVTAVAHRARPDELRADPLHRDGVKISAA